MSLFPHSRSLVRSSSRDTGRTLSLWFARGAVLSLGLASLASAADPAFQEKPFDAASSDPDSVHTASADSADSADSAAPADEPAWGQFRGRGARGLSPTAGPEAFDVEGDRNLLFKVPVPGLGHSAPVIAGDRVFLTTAVREGEGGDELKVGLYGDIEPVEDDASHRFLVLAYDRSTGEELWRREAHQGVPTIARHPKATHANSTVATDGRTVVAFFGSEGLHAYRVDGEPLWSRDFGTLDSGYFAAPEAQWGFASSPVIAGDRVVVQADVQEGSFLAALDLATGKTVWRTERSDVPTWSTPTVVDTTDGRQVVFVNGYRELGGYDLATGERVWSGEGGGDIPVPTPFEADGMVLYSQAHGVAAPLIAVAVDARGDLAKSKEARTEHLAWLHSQGGAYMPTPIVADGRFYVLRDNGVLTTYELASGEKLWDARVARGRSAFTASPIVAGDRLYLTGESGDIHVVAIEDEFRKLSTNPLGEVTLATPAAADGTLFFRTRRHLVAVRDEGEMSAADRAEAPAAEEPAAEEPAAEETETSATTSETSEETDDEGAAHGEKTA